MDEYWEMPPEEEMTEEELAWLDSWLENCPPEPDRDGRREAYYQNGMIPPFPLY